MTLAKTLEEDHEACSAIRCDGEEAVPERCPAFDQLEYCRARRLADDATEPLDTTGGKDGDQTIPPAGATDRHDGEAADSE